MQKINWKFPLPRPHTGIPLGNAVTGLLIWGETDCLKITVGRADLWDHRGGMQWSEKHNYKDIRALLESGDEEKLKELFKSDTKNVAGIPCSPSVLPVGRIDLHLPQGSELTTGQLNLSNGSVMVCYNRAGSEFSITIALSILRQEFYCEMPASEDSDIQCVPAWEYVGEYLSSIGFSAPVTLEEAGIGGWIQSCPADPAVCVAFRKNGNTVFAMTARDDNI